MIETAVILTTTVNDIIIAEKIATQAITKKLAACVSIHENTKSIYRWENKVQNDSEVEIVFKTIYVHSGKIKKLIKRLSTYEIPQIIVTPILAMSDEYEAWYMEQFDV